MGSDGCMPTAAGPRHASGPQTRGTIDAQRGIGRSAPAPLAAPPTRPAVHDDLVNRQFVADAPDRLWVTDITQHRTGEGWVYCAVVLDVFSRRAVGWSITADHLRTGNWSWTP